MILQANAQTERTRGAPRVNYARTVLLLPNILGEEIGAWYAAAMPLVADSRFRFTVLCSADDAGIGDLSNRTIIAFWPETWGDDLAAFYSEHYFGVRLFYVATRTPDDLRRWVARVQRDGPDWELVPLAARVKAMVYRIMTRRIKQ